MRIYLLVEHEDYGQPFILGAFPSLTDAHAEALKYIETYQFLEYPSDSALVGTEECPCFTWQNGNGLLYICSIMVQT